MRKRIIRANSITLYINNLYNRSRKIECKVEGDIIDKKYKLYIKLDRVTQIA